LVLIADLFGRRYISLLEFKNPIILLSGHTALRDGGARGTQNCLKLLVQLGCSSIDYMGVHNIYNNIFLNVSQKYLRRHLHLRYYILLMKDRVGRQYSDY
jgi:hypothetical protein